MNNSNFSFERLPSQPVDDNTAFNEIIKALRNRVKPDPRYGMESPLVELPGYLQKRLANLFRAKLGTLQLLDFTPNFANNGTGHLQLTALRKCFFSDDFMNEDTQTVKAVLECAKFIINLDAQNKAKSNEIQLEHFLQPGSYSLYEYDVILQLLKDNYHISDEEGLEEQNFIIEHTINQDNRTNLTSNPVTVNVRLRGKPLPDNQPAHNSNESGTESDTEPLQNQDPMALETIRLNVGYPSKDFGSLVKNPELLTKKYELKFYKKNGEGKFKFIQKEQDKNIGKHKPSQRNLNEDGRNECQNDTDNEDCKFEVKKKFYTGNLEISEEEAGMFIPKETNIKPQKLKTGVEYDASLLESLGEEASDLLFRSYEVVFLVGGKFMLCELEDKIYLR
jgi:hypothetical protein